MAGDREPQAATAEEIAKNAEKAEGAADRAEAALAALAANLGVIAEKYSDYSAKKDRSFIEGRRFSSATDAAKEIFQGFNDWTGILTSRSVEMGFAVIAANWAYHGSKMMESTFAKWSMGAAIAFFCILLAGTAWMARLLRNRQRAIDGDKRKFQAEFESHASMGRDPWPYTARIEGLETFLRWIRLWFPLIAGLLFILGVLFPSR